MSGTQTEKRTRAGQNRSKSASADEVGGREQVDQAELSRHLAEIAEKSRRLVADFLARQGGEGGGGEIGMANPMAIGAAFFEMTARLMSDPSLLVQAQMSLWSEYARLWQNTTHGYSAERPSRSSNLPLRTAAFATRRGATMRCSILSSRVIC